LARLEGDFISRVTSGAVGALWRYAARRQQDKVARAFADTPLHSGRALTATQL
jgi:hypothetical protein